MCTFSQHIVKHNDSQSVYSADMSRIIDRALTRAEALGMDQAALARKLNTSDANITNWKSRGLPAARYQEMAAALDWTVDQLLDGHAPHQVGTLEERANYGMQPIMAWKHAHDLPAGDFVFIPRLNILLHAGDGKDQLGFDLGDQLDIEFTKEKPQAFRAEWIRESRLKPSALASMVAAGDSMEPRIYNGDAVVVDTSQREIVDGKVFALWYDGSERIKRLSRRPGGGLIIASDNPKFPEIALTAEEAKYVRIIGKIVHIAGTGGL